MNSTSDMACGLMWISAAIVYDDAMSLYRGQKWPVMQALGKDSADQHGSAVGLAEGELPQRICKLVPSSAADAAVPV